MKEEKGGLEKKIRKGGRMIYDEKIERMRKVQRQERDTEIRKSGYNSKYEIVINSVYITLPQGRFGRRMKV